MFFPAVYPTASHGDEVMLSVLLPIHSALRRNFLCLTQTIHAWAALDVTESAREATAGFFIAQVFSMLKS